jgi:hypothetical protein
LFHLIGVGGVFDGWLLELFRLDSEVLVRELDIVCGVGYLLLSIGAIYSKRVFDLLFLVAFAFMGWMFLMNN